MDKKGFVYDSTSNKIIYAIVSRGHFLIIRIKTDNRK
jgi:hypothetical protein